MCDCMHCCLPHVVNHRTSLQGDGQSCVAHPGFKWRLHFKAPCKLAWSYSLTAGGGTVSTCDSYLVDDAAHACSD